MNETTMSDLLTLGIDRGLVALSDNSKRIRYPAHKKSYKFTDPEEIVRAEYYVELVVKYGYNPDCMDVEVAVPRRTPNDLADIVVYTDAGKKQPYLVVECKKDGIADSEFLQAIEQAFGNSNSLRANFTAAVAGNTRRFFDVANHPAGERTKNIIADIPVMYGSVEESKFKKGDTTWDIMAVPKDVLIQALSKCHDTLWDGGRMDATEAFDELCKFIFVKMQDELRPRKDAEPYDFQIKTNETPDSVHHRILRLYNQAKQRDPEVFSDNFVANAEKTLTIVNHLQGMSLSKTDLDTKGVAFENFMEDFFKGRQGQFFTPREIVRFVIQMCDVDRDSLVLDPACGSGGFLLYAMDHIRSKASDYFDIGTVDHYRYWHEFASNRLYGIEINDRISRVAKMNMVLHDDGHTNIVCHDALDSMEQLAKANPGLKASSFDAILTNPPFGATVKFDEKPYSNSFVLGRTTSKARVLKEQQSEVLFLERCWEFLKPKTGQLAIVLPDGILTNHRHAYVRDFILRRFQIKAIVSLPQVTFKHYGAGARSSILIMRKKGEEETDTDYGFFAAVSEAVGYDATGRPGKNDLPLVLKKYRDFSDRGISIGEDLAYTKTISQFNSQRLDPYYYSPSFDRVDQMLLDNQYPLHTIADVCVKDGIFSGTTPKKDDYSANPDHPGIVKVSSLKRGKVDLKLLGHVSPGLESNKRVQDGDILMLSAAHQAEYLGRNHGIVEMESESTSISFVAELMCLRVNREIMNPYYLLQLLTTETYYRLVNRAKRGQTSHIYPRDIGMIKVPVPPLDVQERSAQVYKRAYTKYRQYIDNAERYIADVASRFGEEFFPM